MDASKLTQMRMEAANTYKSNWKPRDASEVTMRNQQIASKNVVSVHQGPNNVNCGSCQTPLTSNYSTDYTMDGLIARPAGCANCSDPNWGASGGVVLKTCREASTISYITLNPLLGSQPCGVNQNTYHRVVPSASNLAPAYTGYLNNIPTVQFAGGRQITNANGIPNTYPAGPLNAKNF